MSEIIGTPVQVEFVEASGVVVLEVAIPGPPGPGGTGTGGATTEDIQDAAATLLTGGTHTGISFTYNDASNRIDATVTAAGATDLSIANRGASTLDVASSTGTDVTLPAATNTQAGLATAAQVAKLDGIPSDALSAATAATTYQPLDGDLTSIAGLAGTSGLLRKTAANAFTLDTSTFLTANQSITVSGDATGSGTTSLTLTLASVGTAGTYRSVTTDAKGRVTAGTNPTTLSGYGITDAQPLDADLTSIAALATTVYGRSQLTLADAAADTAQLNVFSTTVKGLVPAPGTATGKVLSDSGSWVSLSGGGDALVASPLSQFAATTSAQLRGVISDETGTGALVFATSPTLVTPALGTPSSGTLTNCTELPVAGITGWGAPPAIGGTTPAAGTFSALAATTTFLLPGAAPSTPAAGHVYRVSDTLRYRDSTAAERLLLNATDNLANLANAGTARTNLGLTTMATASPGGGFSISSSTLLFTDVIKIRISNTGETATAANNFAETTVPRACTVTGATWELAPTATGSSSSQAMLYARRSGTKTSLLSANASIASSASFTDATGTLTGTLTLAAGDTLGVDLVSVGTGSSGHIFTILIRYS